MKRALILFVLLFSPITNTYSQWIQVNNGLTSNMVYAMTANYVYVFAGTSGSGVFRSSNHGNSWEACNSGLPFLYINSLVFNYPNLFAGTNGQGIYRSSNNGNTWEAINSGLNHQQILDLYVDDNNNIFAGVWGGGVYFSSNNGNSWEQRNSGLPSISAVKAITKHGSILFCGGAGVYKSTNNGLNWTQISQLQNIPIKEILSLGNDLFVATDGNYIYKSSDNGNTWSQITNGLTNSIIQTLFPVGDNIFCGSNSGVFLSTNNGIVWSSAGLNQIAFSFTTSGGYIFAGTFGGGVYRRPINQMLQQSLTVTITSDNAYVFGFGNKDKITSYYNPGVCNILAKEIYSQNEGTETYTIYETLQGKYIYIIAWSDEFKFQGTIAQFSDGNTTILTSPSVPHNYIKWEVFATGINLNPQSNDPEPIAPNYIPRGNSNCPTLSEVNNQIMIANSNSGNPSTTSVGWVSTTPIQGRIGVLAFGPNNSSVGIEFPPQIVSNIDSSAHWMWYNPNPNNITNPFITGSYPNFPANESREYYIFRIGPLDSLFSSCNCVPPPNNMVAWWPLDETSGNTAQDLAGYPNNAYCTSCPTPVTGKVSGAILFLDGNKYGIVPNHPELDFGGRDFSIDAWIKTGNCKEGTISPIADKLDNTLTPPRGYAFYLTQNPTGMLYLNLNINGVIHTSTTPVQINPNNWYHVAATVQRITSTPVGVFYVNGQSVGTFSPTLGPVSNSVDLWIGKTRTSSQHCAITIDELELFNRALTSTEVQSIWFADSCGKCRPISFGCDGNIIKNWDFVINTIPGSMPDQGSTDNWSAAYGTPDLKTGEACGDTVYVGLWGNQIFGEAIQQNAYFTSGNTYSIKFCARWLVEPNRPYPPQYVFRASNVQLLSPTDPNGVLIGVSSPLTQTNQWVTMTLPNWVAPSNFKFLTISVTNNSSFIHQDSVTYAHIDKVCIQIVPSTNVFENEPIPSNFHLSQCYPNPFNYSTKIEYHVPYYTLVKLAIYDCLGREIKVLVNEPKSAGKYSLVFDGSELPSGVYFYRMKASNFQDTKKLIMIK